MSKNRDNTAQKLIADYYRDKAYISRMKRKWLTPKPVKTPKKKSTPQD